MGVNISNCVGRGVDEPKEAFLKPQKERASDISKNLDNLTSEQQISIYESYFDGEFSEWQKAEIMVTKYPSLSQYIFNNGDNSIHYAIKYKCISSSFIKELINNGLNINDTNNDGNTPLHIAIKKNNKYFIKKLISFKNINIDVNIKNKKGKTCIDLANESNDDDLISLIKEL